MSFCVHVAVIEAPKKPGHSLCDVESIVFLSDASHLMSLFVKQNFYFCDLDSQITFYFSCFFFFFEKCVTLFPLFIFDFFSSPLTKLQLDGFQLLVLFTCCEQVPKLQSVVSHSKLLNAISDPRILSAVGTALHFMGPWVPSLAVSDLLISSVLEARAAESFFCIAARNRY